MAGKRNSAVEDLDMTCGFDSTFNGNEYRGGKKYETHFGFANHVWQCILATSKPFSTILAIFESSESQLSNDTTQRFIFCLVVAWHFLKVLYFFRAHSEIGVSDQRFP